MPNGIPKTGKTSEQNRKRNLSINQKDIIEELNSKIEQLKKENSDYTNEYKIIIKNIENKHKVQLSQYENVVDEFNDKINDIITDKVQKEVNHNITIQEIKNKTHKHSKPSNKLKSPDTYNPILDYTCLLAFIKLASYFTRFDAIHRMYCLYMNYNIDIITFYDIIQQTACIITAVVFYDLNNILHEKLTINL